VGKAVDALDSDSPLPPADRLEPNDNVPQARKLWGKRPGLAATLDYWDDRVDVYRVNLARGERLHARASARWAHAAVALTVWPPGTKTVFHRHGDVAHAAHPGRTQRLSYTAVRGGWYYVELRITRHGGGRYVLQLTKSR
jgi:hypothetical protein